MNERDKELYQQATGKAWAYDFDIDTAEKFAALIRADEREACATVCEKQDAFNPLNYPEICAKAIRARGKT